MNIYAAYCYLLEQSNYTALTILNDSNSLNRHIQLFIGFIYDHDNIKLSSRYVYCNLFKALFRYLAQDKHLIFVEVTLSSTKITEDALNCLVQFRKLEVDKTKVDYLNGWQVVSKDGKSIEAHLDTLYVSFGEDFTNEVHRALKN